MNDKLLIIAGETSGDIHGGNLAKSLLRQNPDLTITGMGGPNMREAGVNIIVPMEQLSVVGVFEVFSSIPAHYRAKTTIERYLDEEKPNAVVFIDYPGFNLRVAEVVKKRGIPVIYYISPQLWAWHRNRIIKMKRLVDLIMVILPFETEIYSEADIPVVFVGHPLLDSIPEMENVVKEDKAPLIGLLPGSRNVEVSRILPIMVDTARQLLKKDRTISFYLPHAHTVKKQIIEDCVADLPIDIVPSPAFRLRAQSDFAMTASGTATLENAILGLPMAIVYKLAYPTYLIAKALVQIKNIGLVNIVAGDEICPEYIQGNARPEAITEYIQSYLSNYALQEQMRDELRKVKESLGKPGASEKAAVAVSDFLTSR